MKKYILILLLSFSVTLIYAQDYTFQGSLTMNKAWPLGKFGSENEDDAKAGLADPGFTLDIEAAYNLNSRFSLAGMLFFGTNQVNTPSTAVRLENRLKEHMTPELFNDYFVDNRDNLYLNVNYWLFGALMVGPRYSFPIGNLFLDFKALGGFNISFLPEQELFAEILNDNNELTQVYGTNSRKNSDFSLSALLGTDLRIPVREDISLKLSVNYFVTESEMSFEDFRIDQPGIDAEVTQLKKESVKMPVSTLNTGIGLVYYFN